MNTLTILAMALMIPQDIPANDVPAQMATPPSAEDLAEVAPSFASFIGVGATISLRCQAALNGDLENCEVTGARPGGLGYEEAALAVAKLAIAAPAVVAGVPTVSYLDWELVFPGRTLPETTESGSAATVPAAELAAARQIYARNRLLDEARPLVADVGADRRAQVDGWIVGEWPSDEEFADSSTLMLARLLGPEELNALVAGFPIEREFPTEAEIRAAARTGFDELGAARRLRARYCLRYEC